MKRVLFASLLSVALLTSCQKEQQFVSASAGDEVITTISVSMAPETKATIDNDGAAAKVNRCILEVYSNNKVYRHVETTVDDNLTATFQLPLVISQKYDFLFWADCATLDTSIQKFTDLYYNTQSLKAVTIIDENSGNLDAKDAFFCYDHDVTFTGKAEKNYVLRRPFAQVNIVTNDLLDVKNSVDADLAAELWPAKMSVEYTTTFPTVFNVYNGVASEPKTINRKAEAVYGCAEAAAFNTLNMDYFFVNVEDGETVNDFGYTETPNPEKKSVFAITKAEITLANDSVITILENAENIPIKRNYRTNIIGSFLTDPMDFNVVVNPIWEDPDYNPLPAPPAEPQGCVVGEPDEEGNVKAEATEGSTVVVVPDGVTEFVMNPGSDGGQYNMDIESVTFPSTLKETDATFCKNLTDITYNCDPDHDLMWYFTSFYGTGENERGFTINIIGIAKSFKILYNGVEKDGLNTGQDSNFKVVVNLPAGWTAAGLGYPKYCGGGNTAVTEVYEDGTLIYKAEGHTQVFPATE